MLELTVDAAAVARWRDGAEPAELADALAGVGLRGDAHAEAAARVNAAVASPGLVADLVIRAAGHEVQVGVALGAALVAVLDRTGADPDVRSVILGAPSDLPRLIADLVDLGPRPFDARRGPVLVPAGAIDAYAGSDGPPAAELEALQSELGGAVDPEAVAALVGGGAVRWTLTLAGESDAADAGRRPLADLVDAGDRGLWALLPHGKTDALIATPVTAGAVWLALAEAVAAALKPLQRGRDSAR